MWPWSSKKKEPVARESSRTRNMRAQLQLLSHELNNLMVFLAGPRYAEWDREDIDPEILGNEGEVRKLIDMQNHSPAQIQAALIRFSHDLKSHIVTLKGFNPEIYPTKAATGKRGCNVSVLLQYVVNFSIFVERIKAIHFNRDKDDILSKATFILHYWIKHQF